MFAQIRSVVIEPASIEMAPKKLSSVSLRPGLGARASASPSSRLILGEDLSALSPQAHGGSGWAGV
jgi:hypothetical protein